MKPIVIAVALLFASSMSALAQDDDVERPRGSPDSYLVIEARTNNGMISGSPSHAMRHATSWKCRATGEAPTVGCAAPAGWTNAIIGGPAGSRLGELGLSLVASVSARGATGAGVQADAWPTAGVVSGPETPTRPLAGERAAPGWAHDRSLDAAASGQTDRPGVRRSLPSWPRLEGADGLGLELSKARAPRDRAR